MLKDLKLLVSDLKAEVKKLKKLILIKKAGTEEIIKLKVDFVVRLLQVIFKK